MPNENYDAGHVIDWDDPITAEAQEFTVFPEGDYNFVVLNLTKGRYSPKPGGRLPACPKAELDIRIFDDDGRTKDIKDTIFLHSSMEWKIATFFASIGLKKKGEALPQGAWSNVVGAEGRCHVIVNEYTATNSDGGKEDRKSNKVKNYLFSYSEKPEQPPKPTFKAGEF